MGAQAFWLERKWESRMNAESEWFCKKSVGSVVKQREEKGE